MNGDRSYSIESAKLEFIHDAQLKQALKNRRRFGPSYRYLISCSPELFDNFIEWINEQPPPLKYQVSNYSGQFWIDNAVSAWFLAGRLEAPEFEKYALSQFIQNCSLCLFGPWQQIQDEASVGSSLFRFSSHWIAWNHHLAGGGKSEYSGLDAAKLAIQVSGKTRDPRIYDIEHWYSPCGAEINPDSKCDHDPLRREQKLLERTRDREARSKDCDEWNQQFHMMEKELKRS